MTHTQRHACPHLRELAHAQQARPGADLVPVAVANLRRRKGQLVAVVVEQVPEVDKNALVCGGAGCAKKCLMGDLQATGVT
jgi:hypothetical protein